MNDFEHTEKIDRIFDRLWQMEKRGEDPLAGVSKESLDKLPVVTSVKWNRLREVSVKRTLPEQIIDAIENVSARQLSVVASLSIVLSPVLLVLVYKWSHYKIGQGTVLDSLIGWSVIGGFGLLCAMTIGTVLYLATKNGLKQHTETLVPSPVTLLNFILAGFTIAGSVYTIYDGFVIDDQKMIRINGEPRHVTEHYFHQLRKDGNVLISDFENNVNNNGVVGGSPDYFNALAIEFEKDGKMFEAEVAYEMAAKKDPFNVVESYQKNRQQIQLDFLKSRDVSQIRAGLHYVVQVDRYVQKVYAPYFSDHVPLKLLDSLSTIPLAKMDRAALNAKSVALEYFDDQKAAGTYGLALNKYKSDPILLINTRKFLDNRSLPELRDMLQTSVKGNFY